MFRMILGGCLFLGGIYGYLTHAHVLSQAIDAVQLLTGLVLFYFGWSAHRDQQQGMQ